MSLIIINILWDNTYTQVGTGYRYLPTGKCTTLLQNNAYSQFVIFPKLFIVISFL